MLAEHRLQRHGARSDDVYARAKATAREVEKVGDDLFRARDRALHLRDQHRRPFLGRPLRQHRDPGRDRRDWVAQIVADDGDEFLAETGRVALRGERSTAAL